MKPGDIYQFKCEEGATRKGSSGASNDLSVECLRSGVWDYGTLTCECKGFFN